MVATLRTKAKRPGQLSSALSRQQRLELAGSGDRAPGSEVLADVGECAVVGRGRSASSSGMRLARGAGRERRRAGGSGSGRTAASGAIAAGSPAGCDERHLAGRGRRSGRSAASR